MSPFMVYNQIQGSFPCFCIKYGKVAFYYRNRMRKRPIRAARNYYSPQNRRNIG